MSEYWITPLTCDEILDLMGLSDLETTPEYRTGLLGLLWPDEAANLASGMRTCNYYLSDGLTSGFSVDVTLMPADAYPDIMAGFEDTSIARWRFEELTEVSTTAATAYCRHGAGHCNAFGAFGSWSIAVDVDDWEYPSLADVGEARMALIMSAIERLAANLDDPLPFWEPPTTPATWPTSCDEVHERVGDRVAEAFEGSPVVVSSDSPVWQHGAHRWPSTACVWGSADAAGEHIQVHTYPGISSLVLDEAVWVQGDPIEVDDVDAAFLWEVDGWSALSVLRDGTLFEISYLKRLDDDTDSSSLTSTVYELYEYFTEHLAD